MNLSNRSTMIAAIALIAATTIATLSLTATATNNRGLELGNMGSVDVFALIDRALSTDEMAGQRTQFEADSNARIEEVQQQLMSIQQQASALPENDPQLQGMAQQYQQLNSILQGQSQQASQGYQELIANQIATAYSEIYAAVNETAASEGYDFIFATRSTSELLQTDTITGVTQEILARPLLTPPSAVDLTEMIRTKLGYPEEAIDTLGGNADDETTDVAAPTTEVQEINPGAVETEPADSNSAEEE